MNASASTARVGADADGLLRAVSAGTAAVTGANFFRELVRQVAAVLKVRYAFVSEFCGRSLSRVRTLAFWYGGEFIDNVEYDLAHTPCEAVLAGEVRCYPKGVASLFPLEKELVDMGAESYLAIPLKAAGGLVLGHLAVIDDRPMLPHERDLNVFQLFGVRAAAELERLRVEESLRESEERLSTILATTLDGVLLVEHGGQILFCNRAASEMLACPTDVAVGRSLFEFTGDGLRAHLTPLLQNPDVGASPQSFWFSEGLFAKKRTGEEFPIEGSIASHRDAGRLMFTVVLRDQSEQQRAAQTRQRLEREREYLQEEVTRARVAGSVVTRSPAMRVLHDQLSRVAKTDTTVLVLGETGTGKELIARSIHQQSPRASGPLVTLNCGALPSDLVESELFGHEKGAFTGAANRRLGRFELADGGTLFLDEVGELAAPAQAKLLRVLQEREFERVGGATTVRVDVRVVAATHRALEECVECGTFRQDLYYRLAVFPLELPPLRERREDIATLAEHFAQAFAKKLNRRVSGFEPHSLQRLEEYSWPGNVRELQNVIERAVILHESGPLDVPEATFGRRRSVAAVPPAASGPLPSAEPASATPGSSGVTPIARDLATVERDHILSTLVQTNWVIEGPTGAAAILGLRPSTLRFRIRKLGIVRPA